MRFSLAVVALFAVFCIVRFQDAACAKDGKSDENMYIKCHYDMDKKIVQQWEVRTNAKDRKACCRECSYGKHPCEYFTFESATGYCYLYDRYYVDMKKAVGYVSGHPIYANDDDANGSARKFIA